MKRSKTPDVFIQHCGLFIPLRDGKATCPKCKKSLPENQEKRSFKKRGVSGPHDTYTMRIGIGLFLLLVPPMIGVSNLFKGATWDNLAATLIVASMIIGAALLGLFNEKKRKV